MALSIVPYEAFSIPDPNICLKVAIREGPSRAIQPRRHGRMIVLVSKARLNGNGLVLPRVEADLRRLLQRAQLAGSRAYRVWAFVDQLAATLETDVH
ncbi:uncharacterized protein TrAtP1_000922 [Trichoderma atroviride]|uniref:uncharacterized protein n=1 Tax=Hypocrea atroviridis TaxID=63577 RepID=UPI00331DE532|nr:hypothetical protein TrAtP1_000922 [Trichoderma atroviride]